MVSGNRKDVSSITLNRLRQLVNDPFSSNSSAPLNITSALTLSEIGESGILDMIEPPHGPSLLYPVVVENNLSLFSLVYEGGILLNDPHCRLSQ